MTDLEINEACGIVMSLKAYRCNGPEGGSQVIAWEDDAHIMHLYDPLHDDAQAMALVKRFNLLLEPDCQLQQGWWAIPGAPHRPAYKKFERGAGCFSRESLNRAICLCVAQLPPRSKG